MTAGQVGDRNPRKSRPRSLGLDGPGRTAHLAVCHYMGAATAVRLATRLPATSPAPAWPEPSGGSVSDAPCKQGNCLD